MRTKRKRNKKKNKTIKLLKDKKSYSPLIRARIKMFEPKTPMVDIFNIQECGDYDIPLKLKNGKYKCLKWKSKAAQKIMLKNLYSKINPSDIIAPKQVESNCWFNSFFMVFFISDKGRKFSEYLRQTMISGILPSGKKVKKTIRKTLWLLNRYINASIIGRKDPSLFALRMDTNNIIRSLYPNLKKTTQTISGLDKGDIIEKTKKAGNPLDYYLRLLHNLEETSISIINFQNIKYDSMKSKLENLDNIPEMILIEDWQKNIFPKKFIIKKAYYKLDSAILRSTNGAHFTAYLTINGEDYMFDGERYESPSRYGRLAQKTLTKFKWRDKLGSKKEWKTDKSCVEKFTFSKEYKILIYYLDKNI